MAAWVSANPAFIRYDAVSTLNDTLAVPFLMMCTQRSTLCSQLKSEDVIVRLLQKNELNLSLKEWPINQSK